MTAKAPGPGHTALVTGAGRGLGRALALCSPPASDELHLHTGLDGTTIGAVTAATDVLTRLIYGRLRAADHLDITGTLTREDLLALFPGF